MLLIAWLACGPPPVRTTVVPTDRWLTANEDRYVAALDRARSWLAPLEVDPAALRSRGIKGKKKLTELVDVWARLHAVAAPAERPAILAHIDRIAAVTRTDRYHDMLEIDERTFKQDATSYLRLAYLLDGLGLDITRYRAEIVRALPRLDAHMRTRGVSQQLAFHIYYAHFGLPEPFPLAVASERGIIEAQRSAESLSETETYLLTHEVFAPFDYGEALDRAPFDDRDLRYLRAALPALVRRWMQEDDPDLVAELVSCLRYVRAIDLPEYTDGLAFLLDAQQPDGRWGLYPESELRLGRLATTYQLELHTTLVAVDALTVAFHEPWNRRVEPRAP